MSCQSNAARYTTSSISDYFLSNHEEDKFNKNNSIQNQDIFWV